MTLKFHNISISLLDFPASRIVLYANLYYKLPSMWYSVKAKERDGSQDSGSHLGEVTEFRKTRK